MRIIKLLCRLNNRMKGSDLPRLSLEIAMKLGKVNLTGDVGVLLKELK